MGKHLLFLSVGGTAAAAANILPGLSRYI